MADRQPVGAERGLRLGPAQAGAEAGGQRAAVDLDVAEAQARSSETSREWAPRTGSIPPTTLVPPPNGTTATPLRRADLDHAGDRVGVGRQQHRVGRGREASPPQSGEVAVAARRSRGGPDPRSR